MLHHHNFLKKLGCCLVCVGGLMQASAADLFEVDAFPTTGQDIHTGGSSILDLVDNLINGQGSFSSLRTRNFTAGLSYAGVHHAIQFIVNGNTASIVIPARTGYAGLNKSFTGSNRADLENQIEAYLKKDGQAEYAKFLKSINSESTVAVTDGNPNSSTATFATQTFMDYAFAPGETRAEKTENHEGRVGFGLYGDVGTFDSKGIKGTTYSLPLFAKFKLTDRIGLGVSIPLNYTDIEGAQVFGMGLNLALPIKVLVRADNQKWAWNLTPSGGVLASASKDMLAGGALSQVGLSSMLSRDFENFTLSMGNFFGWFEGIPLTINGVEYDPNVSQQIFKNGLKASIPFKERWVFEIYAIHTKFIDTAAVDQYFTLGGELAWKPNPKKKRYWKIGVYSDISGEFTSAHAQFGTVWKF
jgi:hypothetical protein